MEPDPQLEQWLSRKLKHLPELRAPGTLAPRVMARIRARAAAPWYRQPWFHWPPVWQAGSLAAAVSLLVLGGWLVGEFLPQMSVMKSTVYEQVAGFLNHGWTVWSSDHLASGSWVWAFLPVLARALGGMAALAVISTFLVIALGLLVKRELKTP